MLELVHEIVRLRLLDVVLSWSQNAKVGIARYRSWLSV